MREIDRIAQEQFNGNINQAIKHLLITGEKGSFSPYVKTLTQEEARFALTVIKKEMVKVSGGAENYNHFLETQKNTARAEFIAGKSQKRKKQSVRMAAVRRNRCFSAVYRLDSFDKQIGYIN